jgi:hypothetical protein
MERAVRLFVIGSLIACGACTHNKPDPNAAAYAAVSSGTGDDFKAAIHDNTKLFQSGPQQLSGPDARLKKGTLVRIVRRQLGYSLVQTTATNQLGWIANDDLGLPSSADAAVPAGMPNDNNAASGTTGAGITPPTPVTKSGGDSAIVGHYKIGDPGHDNPASTGRPARANSSASPQPTPQQ